MQGLIPNLLTPERISQLGNTGTLKGRAFGSDVNVDRPSNSKEATCLGDVIMRMNRRMAESDARLPLAKTVTVFSFHSSKCEVDQRGRLVFALHADKAAWLALLNSDITGQVTQRQQAWRRTKEIEAVVCEIIGCNDIYCANELLASPTYVTFLERLRSEKDTLQKVYRCQPSLSRLAIRIQITSDFSWDRKLGLINVPVHTTISSLADFLMAQGHDALEAHDKYQAYMEAFDSLTLRVKRRFRLKGLLQHSTVSHDCMLAACEKLLECPLEHQTLFSGLVIRISTRYFYDDTEGLVDIPSDFYYDEILSSATAYYS